MTARLGNVLYWAFSGLAAVILLVGIPLSSDNHAAPVTGFCLLFGVPALLAWLLGRACHYVLGGDAPALWLVVGLGVWLLVLLVLVALVFILYVFAKDIALFLTTAFFIVLEIAAPCVLIHWLYVYVPASRSDKLWRRFKWGLALFGLGSFVVALALASSQPNQAEFNRSMDQWGILGGFTFLLAIVASIGRESGRLAVEEAFRKTSEP
jgi:hypothetical protein